MNILTGLIGETSTPPLKLEWNFKPATKTKTRGYEADQMSLWETSQMD